MQISSAIAECVGLWLAEGDNKTTAEITFTNNCLPLLKHFDSTLRSLFPVPNARLYVYSRTGEQAPYFGDFSAIKHYTDERANKPYYIWRVASVKQIRDWKEIVSMTLSKQKYWPDVLRGFFAGEGSVKTSSHHQRNLRIAQKCEKQWVNKILHCLKISYKFEKRNRTYEIWGKQNWDIFASYFLADLHPDKKELFWTAYNSFQQEHYKRGSLRKFLLAETSYPQNASLLAEKYSRSQSRISMALSDLKRAKAIRHFRVGSISYWVRRDTNIIPISRIKSHYLKTLQNGPRTTKELSLIHGRCARSVCKRLLELQRLGLVKKDKINNWKLAPTTARIITL